MIEEVKATARAAGKAEGKAEGKTEGKRDAVIMLLAARGLLPDPVTCERILAEQDPQRLDRWIVLAASCAANAELFDET